MYADTHAGLLLLLSYDDLILLCWDFEGLFLNNSQS